MIRWRLNFRNVLVFLLCTASLSGQSLLKAVQDGDLESVKSILTGDTSLINMADAAGRQAIHFAANAGSADMVSYLLSMGSDKEAETLAGTMPIHYAAFSGDLGTLRLFAEGLSSVDVRNRQGITPLYYAAAQGHTNAVRFLIERGAEIDALDAEGGTPFLAASQAGKTEMAVLLMEEGADVLRNDVNGCSALHYACREGQMEMVNRLIEKGLNISDQDLYGKTSFVYALETGHEALSKDLMMKNPDVVKSVSADRSTSLHAAVQGGLAGMAVPLIEAGVEKNRMNAYGLTALDYAIQKKDTVLIDLLNEEGAVSNREIIKNPIGKYLGQKPPGSDPVLFAPGLIATPFANERDVQFTKDGRTLYFSRWIQGEWDIFVVRQNKEGWSSAQPVVFSSPYFEAEAYLTQDEQRHFFISNRPESGDGPAGPWEIWFVKKDGQAWSEPMMLGGAFHGGFYTTFTKNGTMHLTLDGKMQYAKAVNGGFADPEPLPESVNGTHGGYNGFVAPDESYLIFTTTIEGEGYGEGDLYITFRKPDGTWTKAQNMGERVNSFARDYCPSVSPDGKYFFFSSRRYGNEDIFWMDAGFIIQFRSLVDF